MSDSVSASVDLSKLATETFAYLDPLKTQLRLLPLSIFDSIHIPEKVVDNSVPFGILILHLSRLKSIKIVNGLIFFPTARHIETIVLKNISFNIRR